VDTSTEATKTALTLDPITGDNVITLAESGAASTTLTGKVTGAFVVGDIVTITLGLPSGIKTYSAAVDASGAYSLAVSTADLVADTDTQVQARIAATVDGLKKTADAAQDYTVESTGTLTQTALSIAPITSDNIINLAESTANGGITAVTGKVTGKFASGDIVTLTVNTQPYSAAVDASGNYSINVPTAQLLADSNTQIEGSVTGTGGTLANALQNYAVDTAPPVGTVITIDAITGDDFISSAEAGASVTITGTVTGEFRAGDKVTITVGGADYTGTVNAAGQYAVSGVQGNKFGPDTDQKVEAKILASDSSGNSATFSATPRAYTVDTSTEATKTRSRPCYSW
jgi:hypothetical protein